MIVLAESSLYSMHNSWRDAFTSFFPAAGLHLASIDISKPSPNSSSNEPISLASLEETLSKDLSHLCTMANDRDHLFIPVCSTPSTTSAHTVLIARGPIPSLVSQYFLESLPLAGLVLVDPLLLPEDGRVKKKSSNGRLSSSLDDMVPMLEGRRPMMYQDTTTLPDNNDHPLSKATTQSHTKSELALLQALTKQRNNARPLYLEPSSVPILVLYTGNHMYQDYYRICAERTAAFHTCGGGGDYFDQVSVLKIPKENDGGEGISDDLNWVTERVYEWYDAEVA